MSCIAQLHPLCYTRYFRGERIVHAKLEKAI